MRRIVLLIPLVLSLSVAVAARKPRLTPDLEVLDNGIGRGQLSLDAQADMVKWTGYAGVGYTSTKQVGEMLKALDQRGLRMSSLYVVLSLDDAQALEKSGLAEAIERLRGRKAVILLGLTGKSGQRDDLAVSVVREVSRLAGASGLKVALYPHFGFYVARVEEALRVANLAKRKNVGVAFNLCHWLKEGDEGNLSARLKQAMPRLLMVTVNGADHEGDWDRLIQTLERGSFDVYQFLKTLDAHGYRGPVTLQCYNIKGDTEENLRRSMGAWRSFRARLESGP